MAGEWWWLPLATRNMSCPKVQLFPMQSCWIKTKIKQEVSSFISNKSTSFIASKISMEFRFCWRLGNFRICLSWIKLQICCNQVLMIFVDHYNYDIGHIPHSTLIKIPSIIQHGWDLNLVKYRVYNQEFDPLGKIQLNKSLCRCCRVF